MSDKPISRRDFFKQGFTEAFNSVREVTNAAWGPEKAKAHKPELIRPPGALLEEQFLDKCTRCNECAKVCPEEAIIQFVGEDSVNHLTPMLNLRKSACVLCEGFPCVKACEPAALVMPSSAKEVKMGTAVINQKLCHAWADGADCDYCVKECPFPQEAIYLDDNRHPVVNEEICTGCGLCENICPSRQSAIIIKRLE